MVKGVSLMGSMLVVVVDIIVDVVMAAVEEVKVEDVNGFVKR